MAANGSQSVSPGANATYALTATGALASIAMVGLLTTQGPWIVFWSGIIGFCTAFILILTLALPPMLVDAAHVHSVSAAVFAIGYLCAVVTPVLGGFAWDLTGVPFAAFAPFVPVPRSRAVSSSPAVNSLLPSSGVRARASASQAMSTTSTPIPAIMVYRYP